MQPNRSEPPTIESFPPLEVPGRHLYYDKPPSFYTELVERGYKVVLLASLPRGDNLSEQAYLRAKLQGIDEGTVQVSDAQLVALKASIELYFTKRNVSLVLKPQEHAEGVLEALDWSSSRYTLRGNTTLSNTPSGTTAAPPKES